MKKNIFILLIVLCILVISKLVLFAGETNYDFRKTNWGMSKEEVKATEKGKIIDETKNKVEFMVPDFDSNFECGYFFLEDKLYHTLYVFRGNFTNKNNYINEYEKWQEALIKKYGKPKKDYGAVWHNDLYKNDKQEWGMALSVGHLVYFTQWETPTTEIGIMLGGNNYQIYLAISYDSKELKEWAKEIQEKETSKGL
jgi:hypothetical protein